ncbi:hypothetical protein BGZ76_007827 [Entomortierella beljakovae]|nr:hypothetical protein BGZ76_007827 [Entomortierella beljakovae]
MAQFARIMSQDCQEMVYQAHGIDVAKETVEEPLISNTEFIEASKLSKSVKRATSSFSQKKSSRFSKGRSSYPHTQQQNNSTQQTQAQTQQQSQDTCSKPFFGRGQSQNRGKPRSQSATQRQPSAQQSDNQQ